ncbi:MAG: KUP/HAK/KT family potassium transporter, partial [Proteobacteria bacterium]|nr:KUP/HAK/KT family potassium transporter [Pseudomonadota bacterium]
SAVEGLEVATPLFKPYIVGITIFILCMLFLVQSQGTAKIGKFFGPIIIIWFASITLLGVRGILLNPEILTAFNPWFAVNFFLINKIHGFITLGAVCLAITGGEALYADMGHFGKKPITIGWYYVVFPSLVTNYLGQGALLLADPSAIESPFYKLAPAWALYPLVGVATAATVIASQALISGAFSLTSQAVQLGCLPRLAIRHTSSREIGQIFVPLVNVSLLVGTILLVATFHTSSNMAAAYGIAVSTTMLITTTLTFFVALKKWNWHPLKAGIISIIFILVDLAFFSANIIKIHHGGWVTILIGLFIFTIMTTWRKGRQILAKRIKATTFPFARFREEIKINPPTKVPGTAIFMTGNIEGTPPALSHNLKHNKILHKNVVLLMVKLEEVPYLGEQGRIHVNKLEENLYTAVIHFGFMETPNVPAIIAQTEKYDIPFDISNITYFLGRETVLATEAEGMAIWREKLFSFMTRNAERATTYYCIPSDQVIEIGLQVEI